MPSPARSESPDKVCNCGGRSAENLIRGTFVDFGCDHSCRFVAKNAMDSRASGWSVFANGRVIFGLQIANQIGVYRDVSKADSTLTKSANAANISVTDILA
jgi:hypothetical protein